MDAPHRYEMSLKKDGLFINLSSDDVYFVSKQMDKWFRILLDDSYVPVSLTKPVSVAASIPVASVSEQAVSAITPEAPPSEPVALPPPVSVTPEPPVLVTPHAAEVPVAAPIPAPPEPLPQPAPVVSVPEPVVTPEPLPLPEPLAESLPQPLPELTAPVAEAITLAVAPAVASVSAPPGVIEPVELVTSAAASEAVNALPVSSPALPEPVVTAAELPPPALSVVPPLPAAQPAIAAPKDDFESVMDTVMRDLEAPLPPLPSAPVIQALYEDSPVAAERPMNLDLVNSLADLCDQAQPGSSEDYLLLASYYLSQVESQACFSLKRINANLVKSGLTPVNHSALEAVLSKGYMSMVPDLSGTAEVSEYSITDGGLAFVNQLF